MAPHYRIDGFEGTQEEYVAFLERLVFALRVDGLTASNGCTHTGLTQPSDEMLSVVEDIPQPSIAGVAQANDESLSSTENSTENISQASTNVQFRFVQDFVCGPVRQRAKPAFPAWKKFAQQLVRLTPTADEWAQRLTNLEVLENTHNGRILSMLLHGTSEMPAIRETDSAISALLQDESLPTRNVLAYATNAMRNDVSASLMVTLANFQKFLVLSSCAVLHNAGTSKETASMIAKVCLGNVSDDHCWNMIKTAVYLNQMIDVLSVNGWYKRASELVLICMSSSVYFQLLSDCARESASFSVLPTLELGKGKPGIYEGGVDKTTIRG